jgi:glycosyltransferase involved in cell wall biosynthesis
VSLKIAITSPFGWPYVRRGNRFAHELAAYLADRGHQVHYITSKPGGINRRKMRGKVLEKSHRLFSHPILDFLNVEMWETFVVGCFRSLVGEDYDIIQTFWPPDAFAASLIKSMKGTPFVHLMVDSNHFYRPTTFGKTMLRRILKTASRLEVPSIYVNEELRAQFGMEGELISSPVNMEHFTFYDDKKHEPPHILCTSSFLDVRKRVYLLVQAFELLLKEIPDAVLQLSGHGPSCDEGMKGLLELVPPETRKSIEILDVGKLEDMPKLYGQATLTALPSLREAFGMVIIESLASGTPVVGTKSGAIPEILDRPDVGVMFDETGGPGELCAALLRGLELARDPQTSMCCREHAARYSWQNVGPQYEALYLDILNNHHG